MKNTSYLAHESVKPHKERVHTKIIKALRKIKRGTFEDIAKACGLKDQQVWKRLSELKRDDKIIEDGVSICDDSGRPRTVWRIVE